MNYGDTDKDVLEAEFFSLSNGDCRHCQVIDLVDEQGLKWLKELTDVPGFKNLNWFMHYGLKAVVIRFSHRSPELSLTLKGVSLPSEKTGKTPIDYVKCLSEAFERIQKGSGYYRRILLLHKPKNTVT